MNAVSVTCPAKVNLYLRVLAREDSGYHQIETVFQALELHDRLRLSREGEGVELTVDSGSADLGDPEKNTVVRAARAFFRRSGVEGGVVAHLTKAIPAETGLGGGSSDAAGTLAGLNLLYGGPLTRDELIEVGGRIGADVPFFCAGAPLAVAWGRGDRLLPRPSLPEAHVVVVAPSVRISTSWAYGALSGSLDLPAPSGLLDLDEGLGWDSLEALQHNDFEEVAFPEHAGLGPIRDRLAESGALVARMTGSGSALFAVYDSEAVAGAAAEEALAMEGVEHVIRTRTVTRGPLNRVEPMG